MLSRAIRRIANLAWPSTGLIAVILIWHFSVKIFRIKPLILPLPGDVWAALVKWNSLLLQGAWVTTVETVLGFVLAVVIGIPIAIFLAEVEFVGRAIYPLLVVAQSVPKVAIAPLILIWLGFGMAPKLLLAFLIAFFPIVIDTVTGLRTVDPDLLDLMKSLGMGRTRTLMKAKLPSSLPNIFASFKVAVTLALIGAVIGEFVGSTEGLGYLVLLSASQSQTALTFAALGLLGVIGILLFQIISIIEALVIPWAYRQGPE